MKAFPAPYVSRYLWIKEVSLPLATRSVGALAPAAYRTEQRRREIWWAWLSVVVLVICWDAATRLDQEVSCRGGDLVTQ